MSEHHLDFREAPGITLADAVEQYMIFTFNDKKTYFLNYLFIAKEVWKALFKKTIYSVHQVSVPVQYKSDIGYYINKPKGLNRLLSISVVKDGQYYPLVINEQISTDVKITPVAKKCNCENKENFNSLLDTRVEVSEVELNGQTYSVKKYFQRKGDGTIIEVQEFPVYNNATQTVTIESKRNTVATVAKDNCGCIKDTPENRTILSQSCGMVDLNYNKDFNFNKYGYFNYSFESDKIFIKPSSDVYINAEKLPERLVVSYQTNGQNLSGDFIIPEEAAMALWAGLS